MVRTFLCICVLMLSSTGYAAPPPPSKKIDNVAEYLQDIAVTIKAAGHQGSGTYKVTKDGTIWVLTCAHVVDSLRTVRTFEDGKGGTKTVVDFADAKIVQYVKEDGRIVGESSYDAEVVRFSNFQDGEDLALLRLRTKKFKPLASAIFYLDKDIPKVGVDLLHCGSLMGEFGSNSVTPGIVSQHGRLISGKVYDQTTCVVYPGSSGGPVALKSDGRYVGMIVRGAVGGFNLMVPVRRIKDWATKTGVEFVLDDSKQVPTEETLKSLPVDTNVIDSGLKTAASTSERNAPKKRPDEPKPGNGPPE